jgi:Ca2+-binding RTX toxin-like protein
MASFRRVLGAFALIVGSAIAGGPTAAATIGINGSVLTVFAEEGDDVLLVTSTSPTTLGFFGLALTIVTPGCSGFGAVDCSIAGLTEVRINMLGGDDVVEMSSVPAIPSLSFIVLGGNGNDIVIGGASATSMFGGAGDDVLIAGTGVSCLSGGAGDNVLIGSTCDPGNEPVFPPARPVPVSEPASWALLLAAFIAATTSTGALGARASRRHARRTAGGAPVAREPSVPSP